MATLFVLLANECIPPLNRPWSKSLRWAAGAAAFPFLYCFYDMVTTSPPLQGFINRLPTNCEYPLSISLAWLLLRFIRLPCLRRGIALSLVCVALVYLRLYAAIPWALAVATVLLWLTMARRITPGIRIAGANCAVVTGLVVLGLLPFLYIPLRNNSSPAYAQQIARFFPKWPFMLHARWPLYFGFAVVLGACAAAIGPLRRPYLLGVALATAALPFVCSLLPFASELMLFDRFGVFYLVAAISAVLLLIGKQGATWRGHKGLLRARRLTAGLLLFSIVASSALCVENIQFDFSKSSLSIAQETQYVPAYRWVDAHTSADAFFLVDDGYDWSQYPSTLGRQKRLLVDFLNRGELFETIAKRRPVYTPTLFTQALTDDDLALLVLLQKCTFGLRCPNKRSYLNALNRFRPGYIFWRKTAPAPISKTPAPIPRGLAREMVSRRKIIYEDPVCEIWELNWPAPPVAIELP